MSEDKKSLSPEKEQNEGEIKSLLTWPRINFRGTMPEAVSILIK